MSYRFVIIPSSGLVSVNLTELWFYRELLYIFVWRDIKVRYKQTVLGILWAVLQPFLTMIVFTVFFGRLAKVPSEGIAYPVFVYAGLLFWSYYTTAVSSTSNVLLENENIIKKVYFPRLILPAAAALTPVIDFGFSFIILLALMAYYHVAISLVSLLIVPFLVIMTFLTASGLGLFLSALNAKYRDIRYVLPFFIQLLLFVTPVIYPVTLVSQTYRWILFINPMTGVVSLGRSALLGVPLGEIHLFVLSFGVSLALFIFGVIYFRSTERFFADII